MTDVACVTCGQNGEAISAPLPRQTRKRNQTAKSAELLEKVGSHAGDGDQ